MIKARLTEPDKNEILRYLGWKGTGTVPASDDQISRIIEELMESVRPGLVYRILPADAGGISVFAEKSRDMEKLLHGCHSVCIFAVTLGSRFDLEAARRQVNDMSGALLIDAAANAAIENICDNFEADLRKQLQDEGMYLSDRLSPGYGDISLDIQKKICDILDSFRRIGLTVTDSLMMIPRKSVTGIAGISYYPDVYRRQGCENCSMYGRCDYSCMKESIIE